MSVKRRRSTLKTLYREIVAEVGDTPKARATTIGEARLIVADAFDGSDFDDACEAIAEVLARALTGEAAYLDTIRTRVRNLEREGKRPRTHISAKTREAIVLADRELKRTGEIVKNARTEKLAARFDLPEDTIRKITPQLPRGRPRKAQG